VPEVLRFSDAVSLAFHAMAYLARTPEGRRTVAQMAKTLRCSEAHLSKVMQRLHRAGLVRSTRGPKGGYSLERSADEVTLLIVYEVVEGPLETTECLFETPVCQSSACVLGNLLGSVNQQINDYLSRTTLSDLTNIYDIPETCAKCRHRES